MIPAVAFNLEVQALRRTARTLLDTYVGQQSGGRVLDGQIQRGTGETIRAVIWLCDLRGFTSLSETLPRETLIDLLNSYFGPMCDAVAEQGGEILKFIGDAMLAIFPIGADAAATCRAALAAATRAQAALAEENRRREGLGLPRIEYGLALHLGDVIYGNIGSDTRLDFTVIGPAVNLTARIEWMCRQLGRPLLLSADFVRAGGLAATSLGAFPLKGVGAEQEIFVPAPTPDGALPERDDFSSNRHPALSFCLSMILFRKTGVHFSGSCSSVASPAGPAHGHSAHSARPPRPGIA